MPISVFENTTNQPLTFILEPNEQRWEVPWLARIGVRYSFQDGATGRTFAEVGEHQIRFWCDSETREVEIVHPSPFDLLLWDICVGQGFCGGLVNGEPTHVTDLLPTGGMVTAEQFAQLAIKAEGDSRSPDEKHDRWVSRLSAAFIEHMGAPSMPAEMLVQNLAQPFEI